MCRAERQLPQSRAEIKPVAQLVICRANATSGRWPYAAEGAMVGLLNRRPRAAELVAVDSRPPSAMSFEPSPTAASAVGFSSFRSPLLT
jgi:hypothetical protein